MPDLKKEVNYKIAMIGTDLGEIYIYDLIGGGFFGGVSAEQVVKDIASMRGRDLTIRLNSEGGEVFDAVAIMAAMRRHDRPITTCVDGKALSAASLIALSGAKRKMAPGSWLMMHEPWGFCAGSARKMEERAMLLREVQQQTIVPLYQKACGLTEQEVVAMMENETWVSASEAFEKKWVSEIEGEMRAAASLQNPQFFMHPPYELTVKPETPARDRLSLKIANLKNRNP